jgi:hypothetical protein
MVSVGAPISLKCLDSQEIRARCNNISHGPPLSSEASRRHLLIHNTSLCWAAHLGDTSRNIQWTFSEHSVNIQWTFCKHSVNILWTFSEHSVNIQWTFSEQSVNTSLWRAAHLRDTRRKEDFAQILEPAFPIGTGVLQRGPPRHPVNPIPDSLQIDSLLTVCSYRNVQSSAFLRLWYVLVDWLSSDRVFVS